MEWLKQWGSLGLFIDYMHKIVYRIFISNLIEVLQMFDVYIVSKFDESCSVMQNNWNNEACYA
jgi:hypothetical protein